MSRSVIWVLCTSAVAIVVGLCGCGRSNEPPAFSLVEAFDGATVENPVEPGEPRAKTEWRFDGEGTVEITENETTGGFRVLHGIENLSIRDGALAGTTAETPLLLTKAPASLDASDIVHAIEIRMSVSAGERFGVGLEAGEELKEEDVINQAKTALLLSLNGDLIADGEMHTYTLTGADTRINPSYALSRVQHLVIRPTDAVGADFLIESLRIVSRKEHLASVESGVGWEGLGDIFRETIVARAPERLVFQVDVPSDPFLELQLGMVEDGALTFVVTVGGEPLMRRTLTRALVWHSVFLDLDRWAGRSSEIALVLEAEDEGRVGFWGGPTVRNRAGSAQVAPAVGAVEALGSVDPPRGVILILADTLRRDHLQPYGHERANAPFLSRVAREGTMFRDAIAQGPWTKVSVAAILTSLYPATHGLLDMSDRLPASVTTLAEAFRGAGYATFATSSVPFTGKLTNLHQGVEVLHERPSLEDVEQTSAKTARTFVDRLAVWLEDHREVPFFAFLHVFDPHSPFEPHAPYASKWMDPDTTAEFRDDMKTVADHVDDPFMKLQSLPTQAEMDASGVDQESYIEREKIWYDASILAMDVELARLFERLEELGLANDTLVAFVSDHGEEFLEHGRSFHGANTYGEHANVPLMLWWPGVVPAGLEVEETVETIDLMPTLLDLARIAVPEQAQGQSLVPLLVEDRSRRGRLGWRQRPAFTERRFAPAAFNDPADFSVESIAMVWEGWKLVKILDPEEGRPEFELYDHAEDPINMNDIAADHPDVVERLAEILHAWHAGAVAAKIEPDAPSEMSAEELNRLRALGYVN